jgi:hypothetical protein
MFIGEHVIASCYKNLKKLIVKKTNGYKYFKALYL